MRLRIIFPTWQNARQVTGVHEARVFENLRRGMIAGLERHEQAVVWGEGPGDGVILTLRAQLRDSAKPQAWQYASILCGEKAEGLQGFLNGFTHQLYRGVPSWKGESKLAPHSVRLECVWLPFSLNAPDAVMCAARLESSGVSLGQKLAQALQSGSLRVPTASQLA